ncbi:methyltransferase [Micromonospora globbae]|uniref:methyltransferase n=1 Tax=Micromonospora globbae TaxID=1894969 RepID=UPI00343DB259
MSEPVGKGPDDRLGVNSWEVLKEEEVSFLGASWILLPTVYPMHRVRSSEFFWKRLKEMGPVESFLEVGSGSGAISVMAAQTGLCRRATAVDLNPRAVENTALNARRHGVGGKLRVTKSDIFDSLTAGERFDLIFWNSNGVFLEEGASVTDHERSIFDPGYATHSRYFAQGPGFLAPGGRLTLGFCGKGDRLLLEQKAAETGLSMEVLAEDGQGSHPHWLLEFHSKAVPR